VSRLPWPDIIQENDNEFDPILFIASGAALAVAGVPARSWQKPARSLRRANATGASTGAGAAPGRKG